MFVTHIGYAQQI